MSGAIRAISQNGLRARRCARGMLEDCRAIAATEFAVIAPVMLVLFFGTVEFSLAVAVDRKVTLMARTLSDRGRRRVGGVTQQGRPPLAPSGEVRDVADLEVDQLAALEASDHGPDLRGPACDDGPGWSGARRQGHRRGRSRRARRRGQSSARNWR